jgi:hypothetical protein
VKGGRPKIIFARADDQGPTIQLPFVATGTTSVISPAPNISREILASCARTCNRLLSTKQSGSNVIAGLVCPGEPPRGPILCTAIEPSLDADFVRFPAPPAQPAFASRNSVHGKQGIFRLLSCRLGNLGTCFGKLGSRQLPQVNPRFLEEPRPAFDETDARSCDCGASGHIMECAV